MWRGRPSPPIFPGIGPGAADPIFPPLQASLKPLWPSSMRSCALSWRPTFLGGSSLFAEVANALALDGMGNVYVAGFTSSADFPGIGPGAADSTFEGGEVFVAKLDAELRTILAATFLDGSDGETANALALDGMGNVYVAGRHPPPIFRGSGRGRLIPPLKTWGTSKPLWPSSMPTLSTLLAATFLGGSGGGIADAWALALDSTGQCLCGGCHRIRRLSRGRGGLGRQRLFWKPVKPLWRSSMPISAALLAATFLGGSGTFGDEALLPSPWTVRGMSMWRVVTNSADFPGIGAGLGRQHLCCMVKPLWRSSMPISARSWRPPSWAGVVYDLRLCALALDSMGNVYVAGVTGSRDFPGIGVGSADSTFAGCSEAFVAKLDAKLSTLLAATFLGGSGDDGRFALALDSMGNVYVAGGNKIL